ncbi:MAG: nitrate reductase [Gammaproteobacteria bacterium]|nr:nitrate reductase [Gammaproteobacteria bacterium]
MNAPAVPSCRTTCPYCGVGCGVDARAAAGEIVAVAGTPDHPANRGWLCVKGSALHETGGLAGRLLHPVVDGERATWDQALARVAGGFARVIAEHGPQAVAFYLSGQLLTEDYYVANKLMKGFIGSANVDTNSRLCMASAVAGYKRAFGADAVPCCYEDLECCDLLVLSGSNAAWTHPVLYQRIEAAKRARPGMRVVVIDPRRTASCDIADLHLAIRPGSDAFLFTALLAYLQASGSVDHDFVAAHTEGFEAALAAAGAWDPVRASAALGIAPAALQTFCDWFAATERTVTFYSQGINQSATGTDKCNAIINCHLATGRIGRAGMGPFSITGQPNAMGGREVGGLANQLAAHMDFTPEAIARVGRFWGAPHMATAPGLKAVELFEAIERGAVKAVWIMATNPVVSLPDADRVRRALARCELVVVSDCIEKTDTTACAHVLLPATGWGEKDGTVTNSERRISRQRAVVPAPGEARHDWRIVCDIAARMGFGHAFDYPGPAAIFREHAALSGLENAGTRAFDIGALAHLPDDAYEALQPVQWPVNAAHPAGTRRLFGDARFFTPSGRARLVAVHAALPRHDRAAEHPFVLITGRVRDQWHTMTRTARAARLLRHIDAPAVSIHPGDAARLGVADGALVEVASERGRLCLPAELSADVKPGELFVPMHWSAQYASAARMGALIAPRTDPVSGQPESKFVPVRVRPVAAACWMQLVVRAPLDVSGADFWVKTPLANGVRYLLAFTALGPAEAFARVRSLVATSDACALDWLEFADAAGGEHRLLGRDGAGVAVMLHAARERACLPEAGWLADSFACGTHDWLLLAGRGSAGATAGRQVCSCFEVGEQQIARAIRGGATSVRALGETLRCGTNCGSCVPELKGLIAREARVARACSSASS